MLFVCRDLQTSTHEVERRERERFGKGRVLDFRIEEGGLGDKSVLRKGGKTCVEVLQEEGSLLMIGARE
jgi:hypothetical protein